MKALLKLQWGFLFNRPFLFGLSKVLPMLTPRVRKEIRFVLEDIHADNRCKVYP